MLLLQCNHCLKMNFNWWAEVSQQKMGRLGSQIGDWTEQPAAAPYWLLGSTDATDRLTLEWRFSCFSCSDAMNHSTRVVCSELTSNYGQDHVQVNCSWKWIVDWKWIVWKKLGWSTNSWQASPIFFLQFTFSLQFTLSCNSLVHDPVLCMKAETNETKIDSSGLFTH